jgi:membrane protein YdbS with pleckstrin-like domain
MSYVKKSLVENERVRYQTTVSLWAYLQYLFLSIVGLIIAWLLYQGGMVNIVVPSAIAGVATMIALLIKVLRDSNELAITNERVIIKTGWLWQKSTVLYLSRVEGVEVDQSLPGRILGYGTVQVRGVGTVSFPVSFVLAPQVFRKEVFEAVGLGSC